MPSIATNGNLGFSIWNYWFTPFRNLRPLFAMSVVVSKGIYIPSTLRVVSFFVRGSPRVPLRSKYCKWKNSSARQALERYSTSNPISAKTFGSTRSSPPKRKFCSWSHDNSEQLIHSILETAFISSNWKKSIHPSGLFVDEEDTVIIADT